MIGIDADYVCVLPQSAIYPLCIFLCSLQTLRCPRCYTEPLIVSGPGYLNNHLCTYDGRRPDVQGCRGALTALILHPLSTLRARSHSVLQNKDSANGG